MTGGALPETHNLIHRDIHLPHSGDSQANLEVIEPEGKVRNLSRHFASDSDIMQTPDAPKQFRVKNTSFGVFATIHSGMTLKSSQVSKNIMSQLGSSFRMLSFCRFNERVMLSIILKTEGFSNYSMLARLSFEFLNSLYEQIYGKRKSAQTSKIF